MIGALAVGVIGGTVYWQMNQGANAGEPLAFAAEASETAALADEFGITEMTMGPSDAAVTIVEYASFTCPHCANFHKNQFKELKANYIDTGKVHFIYRDVFFDRPGLWASMVARCGGSERFFGISDMIYNQQRDWTSGNDAVTISNNLRRIGKVAGLSEEQLDACMSDEDKAKALHSWYEATTAADGVSSTPTLVINGQTYGNMGYAALAELIDEKLGE